MIIDRLVVIGRYADGRVQSVTEDGSSIPVFSAGSQSLSYGSENFRLTASDGFAVEHDLEGRRIRDSEAEYFYDAYGRLVRRVVGASEISYRYDSTGRRIFRRDDASGSVSRYYTALRTMSL